MYHEPPQVVAAVAAVAAVEVKRIMSVVRQRERRATAGKRMTSLVGMALEKDQAFWGHDTWEEQDSGNDSFRESDEDSNLGRDEFDSDFDMSESDHEVEDQAAGDKEERDLLRDERKKRALAKPQIDVAKSGRALMGKKKGKPSTKRVVGAGMNAGLVLNVPGVGGAQQQQLAAAPSQLVASKALKTDSSRNRTLATTRPRRASGLSIYSSRFRAARSDARGVVGGGGASLADDSTKRKSALANGSGGGGGTKTKKKRQRYSQEELLLEAVQDTEPSNDRWLLARKRNQDLSDKDKETPGREIRGKIIERYSSRRGYLNTLTFPEMDHVPAILARQEKPRQATRTICVVTGNRARYRDPRTGRGYFDAAAFRELRRRHEAKEPLDQRKKSSSSTATVAAASGSSKQPGKTAEATSETNGSAKASPGTEAAKASTDATPNVNGSAAESHSQAATAVVPYEVASVPCAKPAPAAITSGTDKVGFPVPAPKLPPPLKDTPIDASIAAEAPPLQNPPPERNDSVASVGNTSTASSNSQRLPPRRRNPSAKVLESMSVGTSVERVPSTLSAEVPTNSAATATAVSPPNGTHEGTLSDPPGNGVTVDATTKQESKEDMLAIFNDNNTNGNNNNTKLPKAPTF